MNKQSLSFSLENTGAGTAYSVKVTGMTSTSGSFVVDTIRPSNNNDLVVGEANWYVAGGIVGDWQDTKFKCQYEDARGHKYSQELTLSRVGQSREDK